MKTSLVLLAGGVLALALAGCDRSPPAASAGRPAAGAKAAPLAPPDAFLAAIARHCGQAFAGRLVANEPATGERDAFEDRPLVMHVRGCDRPAQELRIPFQVGEDRSRTWVITRTATGLQLGHEHRHEDGTPDAQTGYGGHTTGEGSALRQEFPVDAASVALFEREGLLAATTNTWALEVEPGKRFLYELSRPDGRLFQVEFDLSRPVDPPPPPWGAEAAAD